MKREGSAFWYRETPVADRDIRLLRPGSLPKQERFETVADVRNLSLSRQQKIRATDGMLAEKLQHCGRNGYVCESPSCPRCGRMFRIWIIGQALEAADHLNGLSSRIVTIYLGTLAEGELPELSIHDVHAALRQRLNRAGLRGVVLIGGTELAYRAKHQDWLLHLHLLGLRLNGRRREQLKTAFRSLSASKPLKQQKVKSPAQQISYLQKFNTLHRPGRQHGSRRARAYPLPPAPFREIMAFYAKHDFTDFLFLFGARRRGSRIVIEARKQKKNPRCLRAYVPTRKKRNARKHRRRPE